MSTLLMTRRHFLTLPVVLLSNPLSSLAAEESLRRGRYVADVGVLYDVLTFHLKGTIEERVNRKAGKYDVAITGDGASIATRIESSGTLRDGRWSPLHSTSWFNVRDRVSQTEVDYDYARHTIGFRARAETFFLRRLRTVDDVVPIPSGTHIDDVVSATLNYADALWPSHDSILRTFVVHRRRAADEAPDDVAPGYRAELTELQATVTSDLQDGKSSALFDLSPFSSWIRPSRPARIVFGSNRRPELITTSMILGSSVTIRFGAS